MARDVALDVHGRSLVVVAVDQETGEVGLRRRFAPKAEGEAYLLDFLKPGDRVVLEATRGAHRLANRLDATGAQVEIIDPQHARLLGMRGKKTDYRDCLALLQHLRAGTLVVVWRPDPTTRETRQLGREREALNQGIVRMKNRIQALLEEEGLPFPGARLWGAEGEPWLNEPALCPRTRRILLREWRALRSWLAAKEEQEREFLPLALGQPEAIRLMQLTGFGPTSAVLVLAEIGTVRRFARAKQVVSYAGLHPRVYQSDARCAGGGISKAGRATLRWLMVEVAWAHVLADGPEAGVYHRLVGRGKAKNVAIVALARHLLVLAHRLLTHGEPYQRLEGVPYLNKLAVLAGGRPAEAHARQSHRAWAAAQFTAVTGQPAPAFPRRRPEPEQAPEVEAEVAVRTDPEPEARPAAEAPGQGERPSARKQRSAAPSAAVPPRGSRRKPRQAERILTRPTERPAAASAGGARARVQT
jgi:transposase